MYFYCDWFTYLFSFLLLIVYSLQAVYGFICDVVLNMNLIFFLIAQNPTKTYFQGHTFVKCKPVFEMHKDCVLPRVCICVFIHSMCITLVYSKLLTARTRHPYKLI